MATAWALALWQPRADDLSFSLVDRGHVLNRVTRYFLRLHVLFIYASFQHVQQSRCGKWGLSGAWWRVRNEPFMERLWSRALTYLAPEVFDSDWVLQQMNFCPLGMYVFLRWVGPLKREDKLYAWHVLVNTSGVKGFTEKFSDVHILVGEEDPVETLKQLKDSMQDVEDAVIENDETTHLQFIEMFRKAFFNTASSICDAISAYDGEELTRILLRTMPPMRQCLVGLLRLTTDPPTIKVEAARALLARWIRKLFTLDYAFLSLCPNVSPALLEDYLILGKGIIPSEAVAVTIIKDIPDEWRSDELLQALIPAATLSLKRKN